MTVQDATTASWEAAYLRFRTPEQEDQVFRSSLTAAGAKVVTALLMLVMSWVSGFLRQMIFPMKQAPTDDQSSKDSD